MTEKTIPADEIRGAVRQRYGQIAREFEGTNASCCGPSDCCGDTGQNLSVVEMLYESPDVDELPFDVTGMSLGCGDPVTLATLQEGQTVLDLGSGGGIDCFLAAKRVGPSGSVIGVDMTSDMIDKEYNQTPIFQKLVEKFDGRRQDTADHFVETKQSRPQYQQRSIPDISEKAFWGEYRILS